MPFGDEGPLLSVVVLQRGPAGTLCVRINDHNPYPVVIADPEDVPTPEVRKVAEGRFLERELRVSAWVAGGQSTRVEAAFPLTEENLVEVEHGVQPRLRIHKSDERPAPR